MRERGSMRPPITCPWCGGNEISSRTITKLVLEDSSMTVKDTCRCSGCGRTFKVE